MKKQNWIIYKFGGSSVADPDCFRRVAQLTLGNGKGGHNCGPQSPSPTVTGVTGVIGVVVSAIFGMTDRLLNMIDLTVGQDENYPDHLKLITAEHLKIIDSLFTGGMEREDLKSVIETDQNDILDILRAVYLSRYCSSWVKALLIGYGEIWSSRILAALIQREVPATRWGDSRQIIALKNDRGSPIVNWDLSSKNFQDFIDANPGDIYVFPGFIARDVKKRPATLGRNGSDYSASIFALLAGASSITIWSDVEGVLSADPARVPEPLLLETLSYQEAMELAFFGATIIHPRAISPAIAKKIPIWIRSTFKPEAGGTCIRSIDPDDDSKARQRTVKGFSTIDGIALINLEGRGMIGVPGIAERVFAAMHRSNISVIFISQASSEHSICFALPEEDADRAREILEAEFTFEIQKGSVQSFEVSRDLSIIAVVGDGMVRKTGVAATFFGALGKAGVNVRAIAQGSSERNISAVINTADATRALRAAHAGFFLSNQTLSVGIIGHGIIGGALIEQLREQREVLRDKFSIDLRVRGICNSRKMILRENLDLSSWRQALTEEGEKTDIETFASFIKADHIPNAVIIDCTAEEAVAAQYPKWLEQKISVITPNKKAGAGPLDTYRRIMQLGRKMNAHFLYEATVGAGLPVITTLRDLIQTGDQILRIEGVLSGTLSYIFNGISGGKTFSESVIDARNSGFTELDPREDLSGMDVARKVIILAREMGLELSLEDIEVQSMIPAELKNTPGVEAFLKLLPEYNGEMGQLKEEADAEGKVLRYVGIVNPGGKSEVCIRHYEKSHPFASLSSSDNIIAFTTKRYFEQPLIVQGPGAGPEVTAAGVFADLLRLAAYISTPGVLHQEGR
ncbi:MAG: bifunctional aspartate kinase/homoserine dehydrogenase I [Spirochaetales bacterium]|nr:bifunctional aspartate kinase/homoserine dehydrogenase I [Spirochaetales bacterium]